MSTESEQKKEKRKNAWKNLPDVWALIKPRRGLLALGFVLMAVNRVAGLVLPASTKYFVDNVIGKREIQLLTPIVLAVLSATILQGLTSFTLTQLLSKSAQKMITELRRQVQAHIGRLSISFYDANKTGVLVSRIMSDVEGVRNLIGTGLDFCVGVSDSHQRPDDWARVWDPAGLWRVYQQGFQDHSADFPGASEN